MEFSNNTVNNTRPAPQPGQPMPYQQQPQPVQQTMPYQQQPGMQQQVPPQQQQPQQMSQMERLRMQMAQQGGQQPTQTTTMQQGGTYNPAGIQQPTQQATQMQQQYQQPPMQQPSQQQSQQQTQQTPIDDGGDSGKEKSKMSPKAILIGVGLFIVVIILMFVFSQLNKADQNPGQGNGDSSGSVDELGNPISDDPFASDDLIFIEPNDDLVGYDFDQIEQLRAAGYTGDEIEENERNGVPYEDLIKAAEDARQRWIDEAIAPLYDTASDEYKNSVKNTWLGLPLRDDVEDFSQVGSYYENTRNLDYEKVEARGYQLYVKIFLDDADHSDYFFLSVEPSDYMKLRDSGNVVVTYRYTVPIVWSDEDQAFIEDMSRIFIVDANLTIYD